MTFSAIDKSFLVKRVLLYAFAFVAVWYCGMNFKSGPCTPNLDIFSWLMANLLSLVLLLKNVLQFAISKERKRIYSIIIHAIAFLLLCAWGSL
jgi:hypothetical protein